MRRYRITFRLSCGATAKPRFGGDIAIIDLCIDTDNAHFRWFAQLLTRHFEGIIAHASIPVSSGKIEGINNKIKTLRRQAYGYPDDDYFFLKIMDTFRKKYVRNPQSHQLSH